MKKLFKSVLQIAFAIIALTFSSKVECQKPGSVPYTWKNVPISGGGFVDGIVFHPKAKGVRYCRTDMGGAYRWNDDIKRWEPLLDWLPYEDTNLMGVESIGLDPNDPNRVYLSCGTYTFPKAPNGAILRSKDGGKTFQRSDVPFKMGGNENGRGNGERLAVDPNNGKILFLGTRLNGLWKSNNYGETWSRVDSFPDTRQNRSVGVVFVIFDPSKKGKDNSTASIYAGISLIDKFNFYHSQDGGNTWQPVSGQPVGYRPLRAVLASDGNLYIAYGTSPGPSNMVNGAIWKYDTNTGKWTDITPDKPDATIRKYFGYACVEVDAQKPQTLIVSSFGRYKSGGEDIFRSTDGGKTWKTVFGNGGGKFGYSLAPYTSHTGIHWLFSIAIDPFDSNHAMFTTGYGGHETFNLTDMDSGKPTVWNAMSTGIEETVALDLLSPPKGAQVITAIGDYCGFTHWDLDKPEPEGCFVNPHFGNTNGLACAENKPELVVRVGVVSGNQANASNCAFSLDYGKTWQPTVSMPSKNSIFGHIAVSSNGDSWVWTPENSPVYVTLDKGATWVQSAGLPNNTRVVSDKMDPKRFYGMALFDGKLFVSNDGGVNFMEQPLDLPGGLPKKEGDRGDSRGGQDRIYAAPGNAGDLWIATFDGLYHSTDVGKTFAKFNGVQQIHAFGFGKAAPGSNYPALYLIGVINGLRGIFRSDNVAQSWVRINDNQHQWGLVLHITGDPKKYGRVYVGTHGRGTFYGDPIKEKK
jgi:photosystem II stability/assembly factor-like uncharacterized protein